MGFSTRDADHATVAINDNRDIVVAFHTKRTDPYVAGSGTIQQVEVACYRWTSGDIWIHAGTTVLGSPFADPLQSLVPGKVTSCVRPDVIAVGNKFFVTWTRVYRTELGIDPGEIGTIECAWLENLGSGPFAIYADPVLVPGQGLMIEQHNVSDPNAHSFYTKDCRGVADAVVLNGHTEPTVAVVYPHQTDFYDPFPGDEARRFDLRIATCSINGSNVLTANPVNGPFPKTMIKDLPFDGPELSAGMILPDLAPSPDDNAFWLIAEVQNWVDQGAGTFKKDGEIRLGYFRLSGGKWTNVASKTFLTEPGDPAKIRRRPMISSYPVGAFQQGVSLAFNEKNLHPMGMEDPSSNVIYRHWIYSGGRSPLHQTPFFFRTRTISIPAKVFP